MVVACAIPPDPCQPVKVISVWLLCIHVEPPHTPAVGFKPAVDVPLTYLHIFRAILAISFHYTLSLKQTSLSACEYLVILSLSLDVKLITPQGHVTVTFGASYNHSCLQYPLSIFNGFPQKGHFALAIRSSYLSQRSLSASSLLSLSVSLFISSRIRTPAHTEPSDHSS